MPKLPRGVRKHGNKYIFRSQTWGRPFVRDLGNDPKEMRRLARIALNEVRAIRMKGRPTGGTVSHHADQWLNLYIAQRRNEKGLQMAESRFRKYVEPAIGTLSLAEVRFDHLQVVRAQTEAVGLSIQTVRHIMSDVRCLFRYAVTLGHLDRSPFQSAILPRCPETIPRSLSEAQVKSVLSVTAHYRLPVELSLLTGLRWGEIHSLQWRQVKELPFPHLELERTKSDRVRRVPLSEEAWTLLSEERSRTSSVFAYGPRHRQPKQISNWITSHVGFHFKFHSLRHTFGRRWVERGGNLKALQNTLGHSSIAVTERYAKMTDEATFAEFQRVMGTESSQKVDQKVGQ